MRSFEETVGSVVVLAQYVPRGSLVSGTTGHSHVLQLTVPLAVAVRRNTVAPFNAVPRTINEVVSTLPDTALAGGRYVMQSSSVDCVVPVDVVVTVKGPLVDALAVNVTPAGQFVG